MAATFAWPPRSDSIARMDPPQRNLTLALGVSLFLHAVLLSIHFKLPEALDKATERALDVILVNSKSARKPVKAQARGQANLDGGGNTDESRRLKTPLPVSNRLREGSDLVEAQRRVAELETSQQKLMTRMRSEKSVAADPQRVEPTPQAAPSLSGMDLASRALAIARFEAEIGRNIEEYNQRPRKKNLGARVEEYRFAQYVEDWRQKIERVGNLNYPESAKGRLYGNLVLSVIIKADGSVKQITVDRPSGHKVLDDAARRIVQMASPYAAFPEAIRRDTDEIEITRTWAFTQADRLHAD